MPLDVTVDHDRCVGSTMCVLTAPEVFRLDDAGQSTVRDAAAADRDTIVDAASQCPLEAITVADADTGEVLFP